MKAVIVAAGRGKRLMPLTAHTPKPLLRVHGVPLIQYLLHGLRSARVKEVVIVIRYLGERIREALGDGSVLGMKISYVEQVGPDGTGSAALSVEDAVGDEPFMLLWGDILMHPSNYTRIQDVYREHPSDLLSTLNWLDDPSSGASVCVDGDRITSIIEKPPADCPPSHWNQAGLFVCTRGVFAALHEIGLSPRGEIEFTAGVQRMIEKGLDVRCMLIPRGDFWSDVGTPEILAALNAEADVRGLLR